MGLVERLAATLGEVATVVEEADGALTVSQGGTVASLRVVSIAEGLEMVSLTQLLAWDLPLTNKIRGRVAEQAARDCAGHGGAGGKGGRQDRQMWCCDTTFRVPA